MSDVEEDEGPIFDVEDDASVEGSDEEDEDSGEQDSEAAEEEKKSGEGHIDVIVDNVDRKTSDILTRYEATDLVAKRAAMIERSATVFVETRESDNACTIAYRELIERKIPLLLLRVVGVSEAGRTVEMWDPKQMGLPQLDARGLAPGDR
jgi:DNA-directed RNA polymerase subunit K/omega